MNSGEQNQNSRSKALVRIEGGQVVRKATTQMVLLGNILREKNAEWWYGKGLEAKDRENWEEAVYFFNKTLSIDCRYTKAYVLRGCAKFHLQEYQNAIHDFTKIIEIEPDNAEAYSCRGCSKIE